MKKLLIGLGIGATLAVGNTFVNSQAVTPTYFSEIDSFGTVQRTIVITQQELNTGKWGDPKNWIETKMDGSIRGNYASQNYVYDKNLDAFIPPKPNKNATLNTKTLQWDSPHQPSGPSKAVATTTP